ncbi:MAG: hypothetical protein ACE147_05835 [Candidatus Methylomirabilales bacterium]
MRRAVLLVALALLGLPLPASASLDDFLRSVNVQARADLDGFSVKVGAQFGVPAARVQAVLQTVETPADAFMVFQLGQMAGKPPETVLQSYTAQKGKGWGVIAKELGIKPGSREFHALKNGDLVFGESRADATGKSREKGKGKGKR